VGELMPTDSEPSVVQHTVITDSILNMPATYSKYYKASICNSVLDSDSNGQILSLDFNKNPKSWGYSYHGHRFKTASRHQFVVSVLSQEDQVGIEKTYTHIGTFRTDSFQIICKRRAGHDKPTESAISIYPSNGYSDSRLADFIETTESGEKRRKSFDAKDEILESAANVLDKIKMSPPQSLTSNDLINLDDEKSIISPFTNFVIELSRQAQFLPDPTHQQAPVKKINKPVPNEMMLSMLFNDQQKQIDLNPTNSSITDHPFHSINDRNKLDENGNKAKVDNQNHLNSNRIALLQTLFANDISPLCNVSQLCDVWPQAVKISKMAV
jgi:hypothetical protein